MDFLQHYSLITLQFILFMVDREEILATSTGPSWPEYSYGLPKPKSGCPPRWHEGWLQQFLEYNECNRSSFSSSFHMDAVITTHYINRSFCIKPVDYLNDKAGWPPGTYCIYRRLLCPNKPHQMASGSLTWTTKNKKHGDLPLSSYAGYPSTSLCYCCQDNGHWSNSVELPVDQPFYLLPYKSTNCQRVKWALSTLESITFNTKNYPSYDDCYRPSDPVDLDAFTRGKIVSKVYYCYYEGCQYKIQYNNSGEITSFKNGTGSYPDYQYCSWLLEADDERIGLTFTYLVVPDCQENYIAVFDGENETFPLLSKYCGSGAVPGSQVVASGNRLLIVFKSGNNSLFAQHPGFRAKYNKTVVTSTTPKTKHLPMSITTTSTTERIAISVKTAKTTTTKSLEITTNRPVPPVTDTSHDDEKLSSVLCIILPIVGGIIFVAIVAVMVYRKRLQIANSLQERIRRVRPGFCQVNQDVRYEIGNWDSSDFNPSYEDKAHQLNT